MSVKMRQEVEEKIVGAFVKAALKAGYRLSISLERGYDIDDMQENKVLGSTDYEKIMKEAFEGDDCHIFVHESQGELVENGRLNAIGWLFAIYGESGYDVISDYKCNLEELGLLKEAHEISDHYSG